MRQHSETSRWDVASESGIPRKRKGDCEVKGWAGIATGGGLSNVQKVGNEAHERRIFLPIPFQQLVTGTGRFANMAYLDSRARKYGHVCMSASWPSASLRAKVS